MYSYNYNDYLFIKKDDDIETCEVIENEFYFSDDGTKEIDLTWTDYTVFDNHEFHVLTNFRDKLRYVVASIYEDSEIKDMLRRIIPSVETISFGTHREVDGYNLRAWMKKYNFSVRDFLTNKKYIVVSDTHREVLADISDLGLINWENFAECSCNVDYKEWLQLLKKMDKEGEI